MLIRFLSIITCCAALISCANSPKLEPQRVVVEDLFYDKAFPEYHLVPIESEQQIYALDDEMKTFVHKRLIHIKDPQKRAQQLLVKLFNKSPLSLRYSNGANLIAADTFRQNTANCLSLTILAYTLADKANLLVKFQEIDIPEYWIREGEYSMLTGHVNLKITGDRNSSFELIWGNRDLVIDFDPYSSKQHFSKKTISKHRVTSMFYNNKGGQALVAGELDEAYAYLKTAITTDPSFSAAWGNLGLLYRTIGLNQFAEQAYLAALNEDNENYNTWTNLSILLTNQGKLAEAATISEHLKKVRVNNPYYHALLGDEAYHKGDYNIAIKHYQKAKKMNNKEDVFYFGLAKAYYKLGDYETSEFYLSKAKKYANFDDVRDKYQHKLDILSRL